MNENVRGNERVDGSDRGSVRGSDRGSENDHHLHGGGYQMDPQASWKEDQSLNKRHSQSFPIKMSKGLYQGKSPEESLTPYRNR